MQLERYGPAFATTAKPTNAANVIMRSRPKGDGSATGTPQRE